MSSGSYRYGFNGKENDNEVKGVGNQQDYGMRIYDPRLGRFLSVDPLTQQYPYYSPYQFAGNMPIWATDLDGAEPSLSTSAFKLIFGSPDGYSNPKTALDYMSNARLQTQRSIYNASLLWAPHATYLKTGGDEVYAQHSSWDKLGVFTFQSSKTPSNVVDVNSTASAKIHNERVGSLQKQFIINSNVSGSETGLVNLLLGSFFKGNSPENIIFPTNGFGSNFLRNSPQVNEALSNFANKGQLSGKASAISLLSSLSNIGSGGPLLADFIGSIDYSINNKNGTLTLTMTNVTSLPSGTLGKEAIGSGNWPRGIVKGEQKDTDANTNYTQTFSLTFRLMDVMKEFKKEEKPKP
jgi:RHS repeat-associated protein